MTKLYSYYRSSSSYRVRIALNLNGMEYQTIPVHLLNEGGEQFKTEFKKINASSKIPVLVHGSHVIAQSVAIIEYINETEQNHLLYPKDPYARALTRQLCEIINSDIQPIQNLSVLKKLTADFHISEEQKNKWIKHWIELGFISYEALLEKTAGKYSVGDKPTAADCFLIPQVYNALRFGVKMEVYPKIQKINEACLKLKAFSDAHPDVQPDSPKS
jgi:maleylpyruvate isomerase